MSGPPAEVVRSGKSASQVRFENPLVKWGMRETRGDSGDEVGGTWRTWRTRTTL